MLPEDQVKISRERILEEFDYASVAISRDESQRKTMQEFEKTLDNAISNWNVDDYWCFSVYVIHIDKNGFIFAAYAITYVDSWSE